MKLVKYKAIFSLMIMICTIIMCSEQMRADELYNGNVYEGPNYIVGVSTISPYTPSNSASSSGMYDFKKTKYLKILGGGYYSSISVYNGATCVYSNSWSDNTGNVNVYVDASSWDFIGTVNVSCCSGINSKNWELGGGMSAYALDCKPIQISTNLMQTNISEILFKRHNMM